MINLINIDDSFWRVIKLFEEKYDVKIRTNFDLKDLKITILIYYEGNVQKAIFMLEELEYRKIDILIRNFKNTLKELDNETKL